MTAKNRSKAKYDDGGKRAGTSINKTIGDIEALLTGSEMTPHNDSIKRIELRAMLLEAFEQLGETWYRKGFKEILKKTS